MKKLYKIILFAVVMVLLLNSIAIAAMPPKDHINYTHISYLAGDFDFDENGNASIIVILTPWHDTFTCRATATIMSRNGSTWNQERQYYFTDSPSLDKTVDNIFLPRDKDYQCIFHFYVCDSNGTVLEQETTRSKIFPALTQA